MLKLCHWLVKKARFMSPAREQAQLFSFRTKKFIARERHHHLFRIVSYFLGFHILGLKSTVERTVLLFLCLPVKPLSLIFTDSMQ